MIPPTRNHSTAHRSPSTGPELALLSAARRGDAGHIRALLEAGVRADTCDDRGRPALLLAAQAGHVTTMRLLVEAGADVDLRPRGAAGWSALMAALHADRSDAALALLDWGADPDACEDSGYSALMIAASRGSTRLVGELLARGADPRRKLFLGFTALDYAIGYGHTAIVRRLLDAAPDLKHETSGARRAVLALASRAGADEILSLMGEPPANGSS